MALSMITDQVHPNLETALSIIAKEGYTHVEFHNVFGHSIEQCTDQEIDVIKKALKKNSMHVSNIASTVFFLCPLYETDTVSLFNDTFYSIRGDIHTHLDYLERACQIARKLDCPRVRVFPFRWPDNRKPPYGTPEDLAQILFYMKKAEVIARKHKIILAVENCPYSHLPKGQMTLALVQKINSPYVRLLWDPANSYRAIRDNVPQPYRTWSLLEECKNLGPYIEHIHIKDYHYDPSFPKPFIHKPFGEGDIDYDVLLDCLKEQHVKAHLSLEPEVSFEQAVVCMRRLAKKTEL